LIVLYSAIAVLSMLINLQFSSDQWGSVGLYTKFFAVCDNNGANGAKVPLEGLPWQLRFDLQA